MDKAVPHFQTFSPSGEPACSVIAHLGQYPGIADGSSFQEPPAVSALGNGSQAAKRCVVVIITDGDNRCPVGIFDDEHVLAAVVGSVLARINDHGDAVAGPDINVVDSKAPGDFTVGQRGKVFLA